MSDWKYEINDGLVAFYENGIERNIDKVFDTLNAAEARIAKLEAENEAENWNTSPIEDELRKRVAELEAERDDWRKSYLILWRHINNLPQPTEGKE